MSGETDDAELFARIEAFVMDDENFGVDPRVFAILNDEASSKQRIAAIEKMMDLKIALRLRSLAQSAYYGMPHRSKPSDFYDVILALGMHPAQVFILAMALFSKLDERHKRLEVQSYAISSFSRLIAESMNMNDAGREKAELAGLLLELGRVIIAMFEKNEQTPVDAAFVEANHRVFALKLIERFQMPEYLCEIIGEERLVLARRGFAPSGVVYLAQCLVHRMLEEEGVLTLKSPMPEVMGGLDATAGSRLCDYFQLIGLRPFLKVTALQPARV